MKQVECIDNEKLSAGKKVSLTLGKVYNLISESSPDYTVFDDEGMQRSYMKSRFKDVQPELWVEGTDLGLSTWGTAILRNEKYKVISSRPYSEYHTGEMLYKITDSEGKTREFHNIWVQPVPAPSKKVIVGWKKDDFTATSCGKDWKITDGFGDTQILTEKWLEAFWFTPIYQDPKPEYKIIQLGNITVKISKGKIEADGKEWSAKRLEGMINRWVWNDHKCEATSWKIGCQTITREQIQQVVDEYNKINK